MSTLTVVASPGQSVPNEPIDPGQGIPDSLIPPIGGQTEEPFPNGGALTGVFPGGVSSQISTPALSPSPSPSPTSTGGSTSTSTTGSSTSTSSSVISNTKPSPSSTSTTPSGPTSITKSASHNKNGLIGGVVGGLVGLLIIAAFLMYYLIRRSRRGKKHDPARVAAFEVSTDKDIDPVSHSKHDPRPSASNNNQLSVSGYTLVPQVPIDVQQKIGESANHSSPDITIPQRDSLIDQSVSHPNRSSPELLRSNLPTISHNPANLNPLLREILNVTQGRNQGPSADTGDPNVPQNIQIFIINQPSNTDGSGANENGENRGVRYGRSSPRNMDIDTLSPPPSYE